LLLNLTHYTLAWNWIAWSRAYVFDYSITFKRFRFKTCIFYLWQNESFDSNQTIKRCM